MSKTELVFIPTPGMGHLLSIVEFAKLIVKTNQNLSILILVYHMPAAIYFEPTKVETYIESQSHVIDPTRITFITLPPLSNPPDLSAPDSFGNIIELQKPLVEEALKGRGSKPAAFVLDLMNVSMIDIANDMNVPSYVYFTAGANFLICMLHIQALADSQGMKDITDLLADPDVELDIPGFRNTVQGKFIPWVLRDKESCWPSLVHQLARRFREAKGILVNTFLELESFTIKSLLEQENVPTIYPIGPLLAIEGRGDDSKLVNNDSSHNKDEDDIIGWLDKQPRSSVVFLCFGSMGCFDEDQIKEIAHGLDRSGHRFLWSLRKLIPVGTRKAPSENEIFYEALPEGFLDRTAHRGKLIAWAPQVSILAHEAVGGFVTHCGWNSTLEGLWFGVPMATWPVYSEQQLNAFTLVKELGLAVEISLDFRWDYKESKGNVLVAAEEIENGIKKLMSIDDEMRWKVREISDISRKALAPDGGSSHNFLTRFIEEVTQTPLLN